MLCGLEIHQRFEGKKLFNNCPTPKPDELMEQNPNKISRTLNLAAGELGKIDAATQFESSRGRSFEYLVPEKFSSLVDTDEEPPGKINPEALLQALRFAKHIGAAIVDEIHVMRKTVVDGSNTSGFQRTALISTGGKISFSGGEIPISTICIEEESAGIVPSSTSSASYRLDRMGIPLVEITTAPIFTTPEDAQAGAEAIGLSLRMLEGVMRGLGTIRQDVNISAQGGVRIEIKGLQNLKMLSALVSNEVKRQESLLQILSEIKEKRKKAGIQNEKICPSDASQIFTNTNCKIVSRALSSGGVAFAARLPCYFGLLGRELYAGKRFGTELSDYAKMSSGVKGLLHSDEDMAAYGFSHQEIEALKAHLEIKEGDAFIIVADAKEKARKAIDAAIERAQILYIPQETRKADETGGSSFMRPIAGAHRMYPETDVQPIKPYAQFSAKELAPVISLASRKEKLVEMLGEDLGAQMLRSKNLALFERLCKKCSDFKLVAITLEQTLVALRRGGILTDKLSEDALEQLFSLYSDGKITKAAILEILQLAALKPDESVQKIVDDNSLFRISGTALSALWDKEKLGMREFMAKYRLVADGAEVAQIANKKK